MDLESVNIRGLYYLNFPQFFREYDVVRWKKLCHFDFFLFFIHLVAFFNQFYYLALPLRYSFVSFNTKGYFRGYYKHFQTKEIFN